MVKVSVIIPAYNAEKTINKCLDSLLSQTLDDYEVIVINDGSTDNTKSILNSYNDRIKVISKKNGGIGIARNLGIREAKGEYITFVDSDDYVDSKLLEDYYNFAVSNNLDLVTGTYKKDVNGKIISWPGVKYDISNVKFNPRILNLIEYAPWAKFYRKKMIIDNNILFVENKKYEDMPFVCKSLLKSNLVGYFEKPYYYYVIKKNTETTTMDKRVFDILDILSIIKDDYKDEKYMDDEVNFLIIDKATTYMLQQRVQKDKKIRNEFIDTCYKFLDKNVYDWKSNKYYVRTSFFKRLIKNHKKILKLYCFMYSLLH